MASFGACCSCFKADPTFPRVEGRPSGRACTDIPCFVLFAAALAGMVVITTFGIAHGNPMRLTHGSNWKGEVCGQAAQEAQPYMMFCGSPEHTGKFPKFIIEGSTVCVSTCPIDTGAAPMLPIDCLMPAFHNFTSYRKGTIGALANVETLEMTLTESVVTQAAYPTKPWGGRFCLPDGNDGLRDIIVDGPWGQYYRPLLAIGGLQDAWPLLLISAAVASLLGFLYLQILGKYAGVLIFLTMLVSSLFALALGIFFFIAVFMDMNGSNGYTKLNPITSVYIGQEAKIYSVIFGVVTILISVCLGILTCSSVGHVDEMIGLIEASTKCLEKGWPLRLFPLFQAAIFAVLVILAMGGLRFVAAMGEVSHEGISVNGLPIVGLQGVWRQSPLETFCTWYYLIGIIYLFEFYLQTGHYVVSYAVSSWYFAGGTTKKLKAAGDVINKTLGGQSSQVEVRVAGVDPNYAPRQGRVITEDSSGQKYLIVQVGKKGPGVDRHEIPTEEFVKPFMNIFAVLQGYISLIVFHVGSLALGAPVIFFFRPFRMASTCVTGFLTRTADAEKGPSHSDDPHTASVKSCLSLMSACFEQVFGKYSKTAWSELILSGGGEDGGEGFLQCSGTAFDFLVASGGAISHLHGSLLIYELFGSLVITLICGWLTMILQAEVDWFNDKTSDWYIEDKTASLFAAMVVAFGVAFAWMSMWNGIADSLLYCVAWNRRQLHEGEEHRIEEEKMIGEVWDYCPQQMRSLLPDHEMEPAAEHGLHAHGMGQNGAILAAMEHGAMNNDGGGAPDYSQKFAGATNMATRIWQG